MTLDLEPARRSPVRWIVGVILALHGAIHLMGIELADDPAALAGWLVAAALVFLAAGAWLMRSPATGVIALAAAIASEAVILADWDEAWAGTIANLVLVGVAVFTWCADGPASQRSRHARRLRSIHSERALEPPRAAIAESDLAALPRPVAEYLRRTGAVGRSPVRGFHARFRGRIRNGPGGAWMPFVADQVNTFESGVFRSFHMDARMRGIPVDVLHTYVDGRASMRVRLASMFPVADASGLELDRAETVTVFNDLCLFAPTALLAAPWRVEWAELDDLRVRAAYRVGARRIQAILVFDAAGDLVDFVSDDRSMASPDGRSFTRMRWSTPILERASAEGTAEATPAEAGMADPGPTGAVVFGEARWHPDDGSSDGSFSYIELRCTGYEVL